MLIQQQGHVRLIYRCRGGLSSLISSFVVTSGWRTDSRKIKPGWSHEYLNDIWAVEPDSIPTANGKWLVTPHQPFVLYFGFFLHFLLPFPIAVAVLCPSFHSPCISIPSISPPSSLRRPPFLIPLPLSFAPVSWHFPRSLHPCFISFSVILFLAFSHCPPPFFPPVPPADGVMRTMEPEKTL